MYNLYGDIILFLL